MSANQYRTPTHLFLKPGCLKIFIRNSDNGIVQAKYSVYGNELIWIIERDSYGKVIKSDIHTEDEFDELYKTCDKTFE